MARTQGSACSEGMRVHWTVVLRIDFTDKSLPQLYARAEREKG